MNIEEKFLISLCSAYLSGKSASLPAGADLQAFFSLAARHSLLGVAQCVSSRQSLGDGKFRKALRECFYECVYMHELQSKALSELEALFGANNIKYILFKGAVLKGLYPVPESRTMSDIDLLIAPEDAKKVGALLTENGYTCTQGGGEVRKYSQGKIILEVHSRLIGEFGTAFDGAYENAVFDGFRGVLEPSFHLAYLIAHTAHHFKFYGAGVRLILDLAVLQSGENIDIDRTFGILKEAGLEKFGRLLLSICKKWFDVGTAYTDDTEKCEGFIMSCGVLGSFENAPSVLTRRELESGKSAGRLTSSLRLAFPSYNRLRKLPYIDFIDGRPWLTPYAWAYRFYYQIKNKRDFSKFALSQLGSRQSIEKAEEQLEFFKEIGLYND